MHSFHSFLIGLIIASFLFIGITVLKDDNNFSIISDTANQSTYTNISQPIKKEKIDTVSHLCNQNLKDRMNHIKNLFGQENGSEDFLKFYQEEKLVVEYSQNPIRFYNFVNKLVDGEKSNFLSSFCYKIF